MVAVRIELQDAGENFEMSIEQANTNREMFHLPGTKGQSPSETTGEQDSNAATAVD